MTRDLLDIVSTLFKHGRWATLLAVTSEIPASSSRPIISLYRCMTLRRLARFTQTLELGGQLESQLSGRFLSRLLREIADAHFGMGNINEGEQYYLRAIKLAPSDASYRILCGAAFSRIGRFKTAEKYFLEAALCAKGTASEAYLNLALIHRAQEDYEKALSYLAKIDVDTLHEETEPIRTLESDCKSALNWELNQIIENLTEYEPDI